MPRSTPDGLTIWVRSLLIAAVLVPISVYLHEVGHWIIYELNGVDSWISVQRVVFVDPAQVTEAVFLKALFGGPIVTAALAVGSYLLLMRYQDSLWLMIMGLLNASLRILPTVIGSVRSLNTGSLSGFSDEGNIAVRMTDSVFLRELSLLLLLGFHVAVIVGLYRTYRFPEGMRLKTVFVVGMCLLPILISMLLPKIDQLVFGV